MCNFFILPARKPPWFFFVLVSSFVLLFQGHLLAGNKWSDNDMICVAEEGKIRDAIIRLYTETEFSLTSREISVCCLTCSSALPAPTKHRDPLPTDSSCLSVFTHYRLATALGKTLSSPFNPPRSGQRSRASEVHRYLWRALEEPRRTYLYRVTRRVWDSPGN